MDTTENDTANHDQNSYFEAFAGIVAALDALAKAVTPDGSDDGTPPEEMPAPECNSYFASFKAIEDALARVREAVEERNALSGGGLFDLVSPAVSGGTVALANKAVNAVALDGSPVALAFPAAVAGQGRSFVVRFVCTAETAWMLPADASFESDDDGVFAEVEVGETVALFFSEVAENVFLVSRKTVNAVAKE